MNKHVAPRCTAPATTFFFAACVCLDKVAQLPRRFPGRVLVASGQIQQQFDHSTALVRTTESSRSYTGSGRSPASVHIPPPQRGPSRIFMAKPLRTDDPAPQNMQFAHFGVLNDGNQSKGSLFTSIALNVVARLRAVVIGAAAKKTMDNRHKLTELTRADPNQEGRAEPLRQRSSSSFRHHPSGQGRAAQD